MESMKERFQEALKGAVMGQLKLTHNKKSRAAAILTSRACGTADPLLCTLALDLVLHDLVQRRVSTLRRAGVVALL